jgi:hypothetical protein
MVNIDVSRAMGISVKIHFEGEYPPTNGSQNIDSFLMLYMDDSCKDFTISYGETSFKAHKCVPSASSKYFQRIFSAEWKESTFCKILPLSYVDSTIFSVFLRFIYTKCSHLLLRYGWEIWELCDYFGVLQTWKEQMISHLLNVLTIWTAAKFIPIVNKNAVEDGNHWQKEVQRKFVEFIINNSKGLSAVDFPFRTTRFENYLRNSFDEGFNYKIVASNISGIF